MSADMQIQALSQVLVRGRVKLFYVRGKEMNVRIKPGRAVGTIAAPPSKSMAHRLLISASLAEGVSTIRGISDCEDVRATVECMRALGAMCEISGDVAKVTGVDARYAMPRGELYCRESGSTLRFIIPIAMLSGNTTMFRGADGLMSRPMEVYKKMSDERGYAYLSDGKSITVKGPLMSGDYTVVGNISSQFISGLLFALPLCEGDSRINIIPPIESRSYIEMTLAALAEFGIVCEWCDDHTIYIKGNQKYSPRDITVEGDWSGTAFPEALSVLGGEVTVTGLKEDSLQGDRIYRKYFEMLHSGVPTIHIGDCPDLGPILFAVAAARCGGVFSGTKRLKIKESDRASAMAEELKKFGTALSVLEDKVVVYPAEFHAPSGVLSGHNDHRIVMALAVLLTLTGGEIEGAEAVKKSYPGFFRDLSSLGIEVELYEN